MCVQPTYILKVVFMKEPFTLNEPLGAKASSLVAGGDSRRKDGVAIL